MSKYIGAPVVNLSVDTVDVTGDITATDATPEVIIVNDTHEDTDGGREGKVTFKGQQSGGEETTLAQIQASHDGTSDDEKGDLIFKTNDGSDGASPTEAMRIDSSQHVGIGNSTPSDFDVAGDNLVVGTGTGNNGITVYSGTSNAGSLFFADGTGSAAAKADGYIQYDHNNQKLSFGTNGGTAQMRLDSSGDLLIGTNTSPSSADVKQVISSSGGAFTQFSVNEGAGSAIGSPTASQMALYTTTGNVGSETYTERLRIDENGLVGIGSTNPLTGLELKGDANDGDIMTFSYTGTTGGHESGMAWRDKRDQINAALVNNLQNDGAGTTAAHLDFKTATSGTLALRMRINANGHVGIGTTSDSFPLVVSTGGSSAQLQLARPTDSTQRSIAIFRSSSQGANVGEINVTNSSCHFVSTSDYRLKENVETLSSAITRVKTLKPKRFSWIVDEEDNANQDGFLAHEAATVVPEAVTGTHNETEAIGNITDGDGNTVKTDVTEPETLDEGHTWAATGTQPVYQGIDQAKLVPLLTAALQEAIAKIETLETKVAALEGE